MQLLKTRINQRENSVASINKNAPPLSSFVNFFSLTTWDYDSLIQLQQRHKSSFPAQTERFWCLRTQTKAATCVSHMCLSLLARSRRRSVTLRRLFFKNGHFLADTWMRRVFKKKNDNSERTRRAQHVRVITHCSLEIMKRERQTFGAAAVCYF